MVGLNVSRNNLGGDYDAVLHIEHEERDRPDYSNKKDHDLLIMFIERLDGLKEDVQEMKKALDNIQCPGVQCAEHNTRIGKLETTAEWQWIAIGAGFAFSALILSLLWGHVTTPSNVIPNLFLAWGLK